MKKTTVLSLASLLSFVILPFAHADQSMSFSDLHQKAKGSWDLYIINGHVPLGYPNIEITDTDMFGDSGCNDFFGGFTDFSENNLQSDGVATTRMYCGYERDQQESQVVEALEQTTVLSYDEATDALTIGSEENTLIFKRARYYK